MSALGQEQTYSNPFQYVCIQGKAGVARGIDKCPPIATSGLSEGIIIFKLPKFDYTDKKVRP